MLIRGSMTQKGVFVMKDSRLKYLFIGLAFILSGSFAQAGVYFEPTVGYEFGSYDGKILLSNLSIAETDNKLSGVTLGAKLGWQFDVFGLGLEGSGTGLEAKDNTSDHKTDFKTVDVGFYLRWAWTNFQISTAFLSSTATDESLKELGFKDGLKGSGMRFGVGYRVYKSLFVNLDFIAIKYDKADEKTGLLAIDAHRKTTMLSFSVPFGTK
jgi:hypothetical protein